MKKYLPILLFIIFTQLCSGQSIVAEKAQLKFKITFSDNSAFNFNLQEIEMDTIHHVNLPNKKWELEYMVSPYESNSIQIRMLIFDQENQRKISDSNIITSYEKVVNLKQQGDNSNVNIELIAYKSHD